MDVENGLNWLRNVGLGGRIKVNEFYGSYGTYKFGLEMRILDLVNVTLIKYIDKNID